MREIKRELRLATLWFGDLWAADLTDGRTDNVRPSAEVNAVCPSRT